MRILGIGEYHSLGDLHFRLARRGHDVRVFVGAPEARPLFRGMVAQCADWEAELGWVRQAGEDGVIVFESADQGALQDALRRDGFHVFGGCEWGDRLENERAFGQDVLRDAGLSTLPTHAFDRFEAGIAWIATRPRRYVLKFCDPSLPSSTTYVGELDDGRDVAAVLEVHRRRWTKEPPPAFVLMDHVHGIEMGVGAFFDGERFLTPAVLDWEHKRYFAGDLGELTGEMGTVVTYRETRRFFDRTLAPLAAILREHGYCGYLNLNTIVNADGIWPLEFTSRFGYPGFAICDALHAEGWDDILRKVTGRRGRHIATKDGFAAGVVLTVPPFPYEDVDECSPVGLPLLFREPLTPDEEDRLHHGEVALEDGQLVTTGPLGYVTVATGTGPDILTARNGAYALSRKVAVPRVRYRTDIGERLMQHDHEVLARWGHF
ncbi:MAG TPA: hypothetical protein VJM11_08000 [Nevskiaceae bacterium]|nr:hypothetical protein [Nevskiaceae bacterium]